MATCKRVATLVTLLAVLGCGTGKPGPARIPEQALAPVAKPGQLVLEPVPVNERPVSSKSYQLGKFATAGVGEPMVRVRDYTVHERVAAAVVTVPFAQSCRAGARRGPTPRGRRLPASAERDRAGSPEPCRSGRLAFLRGQPGDRHPVAGVVREGGRSYYAIRFDAGEEGTLYLLADEQGRPKPVPYVAWHPRRPSSNQPAGVALELLEVEVPLDPARPIVRYETTQTTTASALGSGFEIVYQGITVDQRGTVFHLLYREFGRTTPTVPVHVQDLEFVGTPQTIDLLGLRLRVRAVSDDRIEYAVLGD